MTVALAMTAGRTHRRQLHRLFDLIERWSFMAPTLIILAALLAYPVFYSIALSFTQFDLMTFGPGEWVGLDNYRAVMSDYRFWESIRVTLVYLVVALPVQVALGFGIAYLINVEWRGRGAVRALFLIPMVVAPVIAGGIWKMMLDPLWGLVNFVFVHIGLNAVDWFGSGTMAMFTIIIIDTWRSTPFVILIASAAMLSLPKDVFEAARIDGASWWSMLWSVALPLLVPVITATFIIRWLGAVKMFDIVLAATNGGPGTSTDVVNLFIYEEAFQSMHFSQSAAMAAIVLVLTLVVTGVFLYLSHKLEQLY